MIKVNPIVEQRSIGENGVRRCHDLAEIEVRFLYKGTPGDASSLQRRLEQMGARDIETRIRSGVSGKIRAISPLNPSKSCRLSENQESGASNYDDLLRKSTAEELSSRLFDVTV